MPSRPPVHQSPGHAAARKQIEATRQQDEGHKLYRSGAWRRLRLQVLREEPICPSCLAQGIVKASEEVHHIQTIRLRPDLKLDRANLEAICSDCHKKHHAAAEGVGSHRR